jgi:hypothetical protein
MFIDLLPVDAAVVALTSGTSEEQFERWNAGLFVDLMAALNNGRAWTLPVQRGSFWTSSSAFKRPGREPTPIWCKSRTSTAS